VGFWQLQFLRNIVQNEVQELIIPLQNASHFSPARELDPDAFIYVFREIKDSFPTRFLG
jgi:hypothetical protein